MTSVLGLLTLWFLCQSLLSEPRFGPGTSCILMMLTIIIPDFSLKWRTPKQITHSGTIVACYCLIGHFKCARMFMARGADPYLQDSSG